MVHLELPDEKMGFSDGKGEMFTVSSGGEILWSRQASGAAGGVGGTHFELRVASRCWLPRCHHRPVRAGGGRIKSG